jgi:hypothetical protein
MRSASMTASASRGPKDRNSTIEPPTSIVASIVTQLMFENSPSENSVRQPLR